MTNPLTFTPGQSIEVFSASRSGRVPSQIMNGTHKVIRVTEAQIVVRWTYESGSLGVQTEKFKFRLKDGKQLGIGDSYSWRIIKVN